MKKLFSVSTWITVLLFVTICWRHTGFPPPTLTSSKSDKNKQDGGLVRRFPLWGRAYSPVIELSRYSIGCQRAAQQIIGQKWISPGR